jgi:hypothetical protein
LGYNAELKEVLLKFPSVLGENDGKLFRRGILVKQVTRNIDPTHAHDLLVGSARACLAFASQQGSQVLPVRLIWQDGRYLVNLPASATPQPASGQEAVLLVDEGIYYFELRALYIRGQVRPVMAPQAAEDGRMWFEVGAQKTVAWDYGMMREVNNKS